MEFHPALSGAGKVIHSLWPVLHASDDIRKIFEEKPTLSSKRPKNLKDVLVLSKLRVNKVGMKRCAQSRCQIDQYVNEGNEFGSGEKTYFINFAFDCDSQGVIYMTKCKICLKIYVGRTITTFRKRFNNYKSSINRYVIGQRGIPGEHLLAHLFQSDTNGMKDLSVVIIGKTDVKDPTRREGFWAHKLNSFILLGLNNRDFLQFIEISL